MPSPREFHKLDNSRLAIDYYTRLCCTEQVFHKVAFGFGCAYRRCSRYYGIIAKDLTRFGLNKDRKVGRNDAMCDDN